MARCLGILFGVTSSSWGGNEKWAIEAARSLSARGHRVKLLFSHPAVQRQIEARRLPLRPIRLRGDLDVAGLASFVRSLRQESPDVLVLTKQREYWLGGLAAQLAGRPLVALRLGLRRPLADDLKRRLAFGRFADLVIVNSEGVAEELRAVRWLDQSKVRVVRNGADGRPVDPAVGRQALEALGVPSGAPVVCGAGRLARMKGFDLLVRAFADVRKSVPGSWLVILGEGGQRADLEREADQAGVAHATVFAGHRDDVREVLSAAAVYALSSTNEGMANTLLEAMSVGAPVVATDVSGTREAVRDGVDALVVPPGDPQALARAITTLFRDPALARRLGDSAAARARDAFTYERMASELEGTFTSALEARRAEGR